MDLVGYQARVSIIQVIPCLHNTTLVNNDAKFIHKINSSWLFGPFGDNYT